MIYMISTLFIVMLVMGIVGIVGLICNFIAIRAKLKRLDEINKLLYEPQERSVNFSDLKNEK